VREPVNPMAQTSPNPAAAPPSDPDAVPLVICKLPNGNCIVTTLADCQAQGGAPVSKGNNCTAATLIPYRLPSGREVVGTHEGLWADGGTLVDPFDPSQTEPSGSGSPELFVCQLPSGIGFVATYDECVANGGTVVGKILGRTQ
jgi:hypothetical protein